ncbi:hypothetical protein J7E87_09950 [Streptomyces sp. ISL-1]|uniref:hypothetical protein n=1 Tax=Streptomyces sp. ISL-1 TaxID=2817657 RepID=UPI001BE7FD92|nr:hypothetical protein [Streptomyces sp. ISL-1]MBT2389747.1 hypothetical protein [Streptomyces sp. ISL-1]
MSKAGRPREFQGGPRANELARFLCELAGRHSLTTRTLSTRFKGSASSSTWALYLNGTKLIPAEVLGRIVRTLFSHDPRAQEFYVTEAKRLWKAAEAETEAGPVQDGGPQTEIVRLYERLNEATEGMAKARSVAHESERVVGMLIPMAALLQSRIETLTGELSRALERERALAELHLAQARLRLERTGPNWPERRATATARSMPNKPWRRRHWKPARRSNGCGSRSRTWSRRRRRSGPCRRSSPRRNPPWT